MLQNITNVAAPSPRRSPSRWWQVAILAGVVVHVLLGLAVVPKLVRPIAEQASETTKPPPVTFRPTTAQPGDPLFVIHASEFVQGQNDLITGLANLATARSQLTMAQTTEKCTHELYLAQGGALKDWQQAQTDLIAGQNTVRGDEIALHAVRSRLRILCETDEEIASLEAQPTRKLNPEAVVRAPIGSVITQRQIGLVQYINSEANGATNPVYTIAASIDPNTRRLSVPADVENPDGALRPGMFATFSIITGSSETVPAVPQSAIVFEGETARVWVAGDDRTIAARSVGSDGVPTAWSRF